MEPGAIVTHKNDPLAYGKMLVIAEHDGWLICEAVHKNTAGEFPRNPFKPGDLELWADVKAAA